MEKHPPPRKLEMLLKRQLKGDELVGILRHLEKCDYCFNNLPPQDPLEVLQRLLANDDEFDDDE